MSPRRLGIAGDFAAAVPRNVEGLLDVMESAAADWEADLTEEQLGRWHAALFPQGGTALRRITTGAYRTHEEPMQVVSGPVGRETVHYEAPPSAAVRATLSGSLFPQSHALLMITRSVPQRCSTATIRASSILVSG